MSHEYYQISKKSSYAIRALLELALRGKSGPVNVRSLAQAQDLPTRFLEIILNELKQGGFVVSTRGKSGGYLLSRPAADITFGQIVCFLENPAETDTAHQRQFIHYGDFIVRKLINQINEFISQSCDSMSLQDMIDEEMKRSEHYSSNYII